MDIWQNKQYPLQLLSWVWVFNHFDSQNACLSAVQLQEQIFRYDAQKKIHPTSRYVTTHCGWQCRISHVSLMRNSLYGFFLNYMPENRYLIEYPAEIWCKSVRGSQIFQWYFFPGLFFGGKVQFYATLKWENWLFPHPNKSFGFCCFRVQIAMCNSFHGSRLF